MAVILRCDICKAEKDYTIAKYSGWADNYCRECRLALDEAERGARDRVKASRKGLNDANHSGI